MKSRIAKSKNSMTQNYNNNQIDSKNDNDDNDRK